MGYEKVYINGIRHYIVGKSKYPSVTSIMNVNKDFIEYNKVKKNRDKTKFAQEIGTLYHFNILQHFVNKNDELKQKVDKKLMKKVLNNYDDYEKHIDLFQPILIDFLSVWEHRIEMLEIETEVYSPYYGFAGTLDFKFMLDGKYRCVGDIKTGNERNIGDVNLQLSAYNSCLDHWGEKLFVLWIRPFPTKKEENQLNNWKFKEVNPNLKGFLDLQRQFKEKYKKKEE